MKKRSLSSSKLRRRSSVQKVKSDLPTTTTVDPAITEKVIDHVDGQHVDSTSSNGKNEEPVTNNVSRPSVSADSHDDLSVNPPLVLSGDAHSELLVPSPLSVQTPPVATTSATTDDDFPCTQLIDNRVLKDVLAYVEVRSTNDNRSEAIRKELEQLGATVTKKFTNDVTHVVFKEGSKRTKMKAAKNKVHLVSVLWVDSCKQYQEHVSERLYPAVLPTTEKGTPLFLAKLKKAKSMQPSNFDDEVANSAERCNKRKKQLASKLQSSESTPQNSPNLGRILVEETQPRTPIDINTPIRLLIPDTPPSMREKLKQLRSKESESTPVRENEDEEPLQRRLFSGFSNASFESNDTDHLIDGLSDEINKCINNMPESPLPSGMASPNVSSPGTFNQSNRPSHKSPENASVIKPCRKSPKSTKRRKSIASVKFDDETVKPKRTYNRRKSVAVCTPSKILEETEKDVTHDQTPSSSTAPANQSVEDEAVKPKRTYNRRKSVTICTPSNILEETEKDEMSSSNKTNVTHDQIPSSSTAPAKKSLKDEEVKPKQTYNRRKSLTICTPTTIFENAEKDNVSMSNEKNDVTNDRTLSTASAKQSDEITLNTNNNSANVISERQSKKATTERRKSISKRKTSKQSLGDDDNTLDDQQTSMIKESNTPNDKSNGKDNPSTNLDTISNSSKAKGLKKVNSKKKLLPLSDMDPVEPLLSKTPDIQTPLNEKKKRLQSAVDNTANISALFPRQSPVHKKPRVSSHVETSESSNKSSRLSSSTEFTMTDDLTLQETTINSSTTSQGENSMSAVFGESVLTGRIQPRPSIDEFNLRKGIKHVRKQKSVSLSSYRKSDSDSSDTCKKLYRRSPPSRPSLVMTSLHADEQDVVISVVKKLGYFTISDNVTENTTHLICGGPRRTLNVLYGIMRGIWVVHKQWVLSSLEAMMWLPEEDYEVIDYFPVVKVTREGKHFHKENYQSLSLSGVGSIYISQKTSPPRHHLLNLLKLCGAKVTSSLNRADIYMGHEFVPDKTSVNPVWVLDCITQQKQLDIDRYLLGRPKRESSPEF